MHALSANHVGDRLVLAGPIFDRPPFMFDDRYGPGDANVPFFKLARSAFGRWTVDLATGSMTTEIVDDNPCELPKIDERYYGRPYDWGFLIGGPRKEPGMGVDTPGGGKNPTRAQGRWGGSNEPPPPRVHAQVVP